MGNTNMNMLRASMKKKEIARLVLYSELSKYYTAEEIDQLLVDIAAGHPVDLRSFVNTQIDQDLPAESKETALNNIGAIGYQEQAPSDVEKAIALNNIAAIGYLKQSLSDAQKVQAQNNIQGKEYDASAFSGLGKKMLAKNIQQVGGVSKNVMTQAFFQDEQGNDLENTVFVIQYDYTLGENITVPANCVLKFDGGSISSNGNNDTITSDNLVISNASRAKIFSGIKFDGKCKYFSTIKLEWFISNYPTNINDTNVDNTQDFQDCVDSGAINIEIPNDKFIHLTDTIEIVRPVNLISNNNWRTYTENNSYSDESFWKISQPCIFSKNIVTLIRYKVAPFEGFSRGFNIGRFDLYVDKFYSTLDDKNIPILDIQTNGSELWGIEINCNIRARRYGAYGIDGTSYDTLHNYTGIRLYAKDGYISFVNVRGYITCTYYGVYAKSGTQMKDWLTAVIVYGDTWCVYGGYLDSDAYDINGCLAYGQHQASTTPYKNSDNVIDGYFIGSWDIYAYVWDTNSVSDRSDLRSAISPLYNEKLVIGDSTKDNEYYKRYLPNGICKSVDLMMDGTNSCNLLDSILSNHRYPTDYQFVIESSSYTINGTNIFTTNLASLINRDNLFNSKVLSANDNGNIARCTLPSGNNVIDINLKLNTRRCNTGSNNGNYSVFEYLFNYTLKNYHITITQGSTLDSQTTVYEKEASCDYYNGNIFKLPIWNALYTIIHITININTNSNTTVILPHLAFYGYEIYTKDLIANSTQLRPNILTYHRLGAQYIDTTLKKPIWWNGSDWYDSDGVQADVKHSGTFTQKPAASNIYVGFRYFCTDKQTTEGATDGIEIIHKGNDVWVDALGRVVS